MPWLRPSLARSGGHAYDLHVVALGCPSRGAEPMGQYFVIVNVDRREFLDPGYFDHGSKLGDLVRGGLTGALTGLTYLLALSGSIAGGELHETDPMFGRWAGQRIAIVGDYYGGTVGDLAWETELTYAKVQYWQDGWVDISEHVLGAIEAFFETRRRWEFPPDFEHRSVLHADGTVTALPYPGWSEE